MDVPKNSPSYQVPTSSRASSQSNNPPRPPIPGPSRDYLNQEFPGNPVSYQVPPSSRASSRCFTPQRHPTPGPPRDYFNQEFPGNAVSYQGPTSSRANRQSFTPQSHSTPGPSRDYLLHQDLRQVDDPYDVLHHHQSRQASSIQRSLNTDVQPSLYNFGVENRTAPLNPSASTFIPLRGTQSSVDGTVTRTFRFSPFNPSASYTPYARILSPIDDTEVKPTVYDFEEQNRSRLNPNAPSFTPRAETAPSVNRTCSYRDNSGVQDQTCEVLDLSLYPRWRTDSSAPRCDTFPNFNTSQEVESPLNFHVPIRGRVFASPERHLSTVSTNTTCASDFKNNPGPTHNNWSYKNDVYNASEPVSPPPVAHIRKVDALNVNDREDSSEHNWPYKFNSLNIFENISPPPPPAATTVKPSVTNCENRSEKPNWPYKYSILDIYECIRNPRAPTTSESRSANSLHRGSVNPIPERGDNALSSEPPPHVERIPPEQHVGAVNGSQNRSTSEGENVLLENNSADKITTLSSSDHIDAAWHILRSLGLDDPNYKPVEVVCVVKPFPHRPTPGTVPVNRDVVTNGDADASNCVRPVKVTCIFEHFPQRAQPTSSSEETRCETSQDCELNNPIRPVRLESILETSASSGTSSPSPPRDSGRTTSPQNCEPLGFINAPSNLNSESPIFLEPDLSFLDSSLPHFSDTFGSYQGKVSAASDYYRPISEVHVIPNERDHEYWRVNQGFSSRCTVPRELQTADSDQSEEVETSDSDQSEEVETSDSDQSEEVETSDSDQSEEVESAHSDQREEVESTHSDQREEVESTHSDQREEVESAHSDQREEVESAHSDHSEAETIDTYYSSSEKSVTSEEVDTSEYSYHSSDLDSEDVETSDSDQSEEVVTAHNSNQSKEVVTAHNSNQREEVESAHSDQREEVESAHSDQREEVESVHSDHNEAETIDPFYSSSEKSVTSEEVDTSEYSYHSSDVDSSDLD